MVGVAQCWSRTVGYSLLAKLPSDLPAMTFLGGSPREKLPELNAASVSSDPNDKQSFLINALEGDWSAYEKRVQRVNEHIHAHMDEDLNLGTLAEIACLSRFH